MCKKLKITAKNEKQALSFAKEKLKCKEELLTVKEVFAGVKNLFGIYKKMPEFEVFLKEKMKKKQNNFNKESCVEFTKNFLQNILSFFLVFEFKQEFCFKEDVLHVEFKGEDLNFLTKDNGIVLNSLQYITVLIVNNYFKSHIKIVLDYENFREKRNEFLKELALKVSKNVLKQKKTVTLEPMNPFERRLIHFYVGEIEGVYSKSVGKEPKRTVVIYPKLSWKGENLWKKKKQLQQLQQL